MYVTKVFGNSDNTGKNVQLKQGLVNFGKVQREDRNILLNLTSSNGSLIDIRKRQIDGVLADIAKTGDTDDIKLLMSIANNLKFGYSENSPMAEFLNTKSSIAEQQAKQNTNWSKSIQSTISSALEKNNSPEKAEMTAQFKAIYSNPAKVIGSNAKIAANPVFQEQVKAIKLRNKILASSDFNVVPEGLSAKGLEDLNINKQRAKRNIDFFLASSECSMSEKTKILDKLSKMMSPEYQINEQLKDKKVKVLSELLNDLVLKTPGQAIPNIKDVNQRHHGMCAAISIARKSAAYEDKLAYVNSVYSELDNKPTMEVFNVTDLSKKIPVTKANIDFNALMEKGYRIVDASTLQWMHISGTVGDGSQAVQRYIPYDGANYGMFTDSKLYNDLPPELLDEHNYLRTLVKAKEGVESYEKFSITKNLKREGVRQHLNQNVDAYDRYHRIAEEALASEMPAASNEQIKNLARNILNIENLENSEFKAHPNESEFVKKQKMSSMIKQLSGNINSEKMDKLTTRLYSLYEGCNEANAVIKSASTPTLQKKVEEFKKLFRVAADYRVSTEYALNIPETLSGSRKLYNIPEGRDLTIGKIDDLIANVNAGKNIEQTASRLRMKPEKEHVVNALNALKTEMTVNIPAQIDGYMRLMGQGNRADFLSKIGENALAILHDENLSAQYIDSYAEIFDTKPDKAVIENKLQGLMKELNDGVSEKRLGEISSTFGFSKPSQMLEEAVKVMFSAELTTKQLDSLAKKLGVEPYVDDVQEKIDEICEKANSLGAEEAKISQLVGAPTAKDLVLTKLERNGSIMPRETLDRLQAKFDKIEKFTLSTEAYTQRDGERPSTAGVYKFEKRDVEEFKKIRDSFNSIKRDVIRNYKESTKVLSEPLQQLYANIGVRKGSFWVGSEGSSGLFSGEQVRVAEQMTGKPHYIEQDLDSVVEKIKKTGTSGVSGTNVRYKEYSGHAQYIADIKELPVADSTTGKIEQKDVLFHDNSWGPAEKEKSLNKKAPSPDWKDIAGYERSDYSGECGGPEGYILDSENLRTGIPVENLKNDKGVNKADLPSSKRLHKLVGETGEEFSIFKDVVLKGESPKLVNKYAEVVHNIFDSSSPRYAAKLTKLLLKNPDININTDKLENVEFLAGAEYKKMKKLITGDTKPELVSKEKLAILTDAERLKLVGIDSKEALDKIPETHPLKSLLRKISLFDMPYGEYYAEEISKAKSHQELDEIEDNIIRKNRKALKAMITDVKTPMAKLNTVEDLRSSIGNADLLINWISKKYQPSTDEELIQKLKELKSMPNRALAALVGHSTRTEMGVESFDDYKFIKAVRDDSPKAQKSLNKATFYDTLHAKFDLFNDKTPSQKAEQYYRNLDSKLSFLDTKLVNSLKEESVRKYGARPAFPELSMMGEESIAKNVQNAIDVLTQNSAQISALKNALKIKEQNNVILNALSNVDLNSAADLKSKVMPLVKGLADIYPEDETGAKAYLDKAVKAPLEQLPAEFNNVVQIVASVDESYSVPAINADIKKTFKDLSADIEFIAKSEIVPQHQVRFREIANKAFTSLMKDSNIESPKNTEIFDELEDMIRNKSLFSNPTEILHSLVNEAKHPSADKKAHKEILKTIGTVLQVATQKANLVELEYELVDSIESGNIDRFKKMMKSDFLVMTKTKKQFSMDSSKGVKEILGSLLDEANDNRTLKLFVNSMGLNDQVSNVLMNSANPIKELANIKKNAEIFKTYQKEHMQLEQIVSDVIAKGDFKTKGEALKSVMAEIDTAMPQTAENGSKLVAIYKKIFTSFVKHFDNKAAKAPVVNIIDNARYQASASTAKIVNAVAVGLDDAYRDLGDLKELTSSITVSENSKLFAKHQKYQADLDSALKEISRMIENLVRHL